MRLPESFGNLKTLTRISLGGEKATVSVRIEKEQPTSTHIERKNRRGSWMQHGHVGKRNGRDAVSNYSGSTRGSWL